MLKRPGLPGRFCFMPFADYLNPDLNRIFI